MELQILALDKYKKVAVLNGLRFLLKDYIPESMIVSTLDPSLLALLITLRPLSAQYSFSSVESKSTAVGLSTCGTVMVGITLKLAFNRSTPRIMLFLTNSRNLLSARIRIV
jgi:hypothetical protein